MSVIRVQQQRYSAMPKSAYTTEDFASMLLCCGEPPGPFGYSHHQAASGLEARLAWIEACDAFVRDYFNPRYPNDTWTGFVREYAIWIEFRKEIGEDSEK